jgi:hypothetical protein
LVAPTIDAAVPAALPCRSSASTCTQGKVKPQPAHFLGNRQAEAVDVEPLRPGNIVN